jgi:hypothetical protein
VQRGVVFVCARALVHDRTLPIHPARFERLQDVVRSAAHDSRRVEVLDAHEPRAAVRARFEIAPDRGDERAEVQRPRR